MEIIAANATVALRPILKKSAIFSSIVALVGTVYYDIKIIAKLFASKQVYCLKENAAVSLVVIRLFDAEYISGAMLCLYSRRCVIAR